MISFIIIGRNIENTIRLCLNSVVEFIRINGISDFEIIYIDSASKDKSVEIAKQYSIRIYQLNGNVNSAIARNVGVINSKGDIVFLIDGDMELTASIYDYIFNKNNNALNYPFITGHLIHYFYDSTFIYLNSEHETLEKSPHFVNATGGLMIMEKWLWLEVGGMDERLIRNQDVDISLRLASIGYSAKQYNYYFAKHHTISYYREGRLAYFIYGDALLSPGLLMRKHFFNWMYWKIYYQQIFYVFIIICSFLMLFIYPKIGLAIAIMFIIIHFLRALKNNYKDRLVFRSFLYKILYSIFTLKGMLFWYPRKSTYKIVEIK